MSAHKAESDQLLRHFIERIKLGIWHKAWLYGLTALLWLSGAAWLGLHYLTASHGAEPNLMKTHGAAAFGFLAVIGSLVPAHMRRGWALGRNRPSGMVIFGWCLLLAATGWILYYIGSDAARNAAAKIHWIAGLALPLVIVAHILLSKLPEK